MSRFRCVCGHLIVDITDFLPYKARFIRDEDSESPGRLLAKSIVELMEARERGSEREFLINFCVRFEGDIPERAASYVDKYLNDKSLEDVLESLIFPFFWRRYEDTLYECEKCGRMWFDTDDGSLASYLPEGSERHLLESRHHHPLYPRE